MKLFTRCLIFFLVEIILCSKAIHYGGENFLDIFGDSRILIFPALTLLAGLFLGFFFSMVIQYSRRIRSFYLFGMNLSFILFLGFFTYLMIGFWRENKRYGYNADNQFLLRDLSNVDSTGRNFVGTAFQALQSKFDYPRSIYLKSYYYISVDTPVSGTQDTLRNVYFTYYLGRRENKRFSKIAVLDNHPRILIFNARTDTSREYGILSVQIEKDKEQRKEELRKMLKDLPRDSITDLLLKTLDK